MTALLSKLLWSRPHHTVSVLFPHQLVLSTRRHPAYVTCLACHMPCLSHALLVACLACHMPCLLLHALLVTRYPCRFFVLPGTTSVLTLCAHTLCSHSVLTLCAHTLCSHSVLTLCAHKLRDIEPTTEYEKQDIHKPGKLQEQERQKEVRKENNKITEKKTRTHTHAYT